MNDFIVTVLNAFKREALHLLPKFSKLGGKIDLGDTNLLDELKLSRMENDMLKMKLQRAEEKKKIIKREARFYKWGFTFCLGFVYALAIA